MRSLVGIAILVGCHHVPDQPIPYDAVDAPDAEPTVDAPPTECEDICASRACNEAAVDSTHDGCVDENTVIYVDGTVGDDASMCTKSAPCKTLEHALTRLSSTFNFVSIRGTVSAPTSPITVNATFSGRTASSTDTYITYAAPITVSADVTFEGVTFDGGFQVIDGLTATTGMLTLDRVSFAGGQGTPLVTQSGATLKGTRLVWEEPQLPPPSLPIDAPMDPSPRIAAARLDGPATLDRCAVRGVTNVGGGVGLHLAEGVFTNLIVVNFATGIELAIGGAIDIQFSSFRDNTAAIARTSGNANMVTVASSLIADGTFAANLNYHHDLFAATATAPPGTGNQAADPKLALAGPPIPNFDSPAIDMGDPAAITTGRVDFAGNARRAGANPDCGAYEYQPPPPVDAQ